MFIYRLKDYNKIALNNSNADQFNLLVIIIRRPQKMWTDSKENKKNKIGKVFLKSIQTKIRQDCTLVSNKKAFLSYKTVNF